MEGLTEEGVRRRLKELQKEKGYTENGLAGGDTNRQKKRLNRQLSHGAVITLDTILSILDNYPDVSADWLLRGNGEMYHSGITGANKVTGDNETANFQQIKNDI